jgi:hypothetical protein
MTELAEICPRINKKLKIDRFIATTMGTINCQKVLLFNRLRLRPNPPGVAENKIAVGTWILAYN